MNSSWSELRRMTCGLCYRLGAFPRHCSSRKPPRAEAGRVIQNRDITARAGKTDKLHWSVHAPASKPPSVQKVRPFSVPQTLNARPQSLRAPARMQAALAFIVGLGRIEIIPFIREIMPVQVCFHVRVAQIKNRTDLERAEIFVLGNDVQAGAIRVLNLAQCGEPDGRRQRS